MKRLSPEQLGKRLQLDYRVCHYMFGTVFSGEAYRTAQDLEQRTNRIISLNEGHLAKKYRIDFYVKTLVGPDQFSDLTSISFDLDVPNYPYTEPATQILSAQVPYSPHFRQYSPVCIGEIWTRANGHMLLGQLLVHIAKLLNWDEVGRGGGYIGWNGAAIEYHRRVFGRPLNEKLRYPVLPSDVYGIPDTPQTTYASQSINWFTPKSPPVPGMPAAKNPFDDMFKGKGRG